MREFFTRYQRELIIFLVVLSAGCMLFFILIRDKPESGQTLEADPILTETTTSLEEATYSVVYFADIKGGVVRPGMYQITENTRLADLVELAGGFTAEADIQTLNLALKIADQMLIYVPMVGQEVPLLKDEVVIAEGQTEQAAVDGKININVATSLELQELDGIGPKKAEAIISYREEKGSFSKAEDLMEISGIGEKTFANLADKISVK